MVPVIAPEMTQAAAAIVVYFVALVAAWMGWMTLGRA